MPSLYVYVYFLGIWMIGPFVSLGDCENGRQYQLDQGASVQETVSLCYRLNKDEWERPDFKASSFTMISPTYGAPLTPDEQSKRTK